MKKIQILALCFIFVAFSANAKISTPKFFSDNMVLQRDMPVKIWGKASKGENVTLEFNGQTLTTKADSNGKWEVELNAMKYGGPYTLSISGKDNSLTFRNVLIGDVWICSGQSNMEWPLNKTENAEVEIKQSANKNIRLLTVEKTIETEEQYDIKSGTWEECTSQTSALFSAVGYYFGKELEKDLHVPIGLIHTSWGGTDIQTWTSWDVMKQTDDYKKYAGKSIAKAINFNPKNIEKYNVALTKDTGDKNKWYLPATNVKDWKTMSVPGLWGGDYANEDGIIWFRKEINLPASAAGKSGILYLGMVDDADDTYINGQLVGQTNSYDAKRIYPVETGILKEGLNTIVAKVIDTGGGGGIWGDEKEVYLEVNGQKYPLAGEWLFKPSTITSQFGVASYSPNAFASLLYNGMIKPLVNYGIKGAIWYQGENNAYEAYKYRTMFPEMIKDWRKQWGYDFPFFWVQLANFMAVKDQPEESAWAELREAQNRTLSLPATGQAVITDIGDAADIHPQNKKDVGYRLALNALKVAYGKNIVASGPAYDSMTKSGDKIILKFKNAQGLASRDDNKYGYLKGFSIAGNDRKFVWAKAYVDGDKVVVFSDEVKEPVAVRYAWADNPDDNNLVNASGLLASPFRTDDWPGITQK